MMSEARAERKSYPLVGEVELALGGRAVRDEWSAGREEAGSARWRGRECAARESGEGGVERGKRGGGISSLER